MQAWSQINQIDKTIDLKWICGTKRGWKKYQVNFLIIPPMKQCSVSFHTSFWFLLMLSTSLFYIFWLFLSIWNGTFVFNVAFLLLLTPKILLGFLSMHVLNITMTSWLHWSFSFNNPQTQWVKSSLCETRATIYASRLWLVNEHSIYNCHVRVS